MVSRVKELVVGVNHQTAPCSGSLSLSLWAPAGARREEGRGQPPSTPLPSASPSGLNPCRAKTGGGIREEQRRRAKGRERDRESDRGGKILHKLRTGDSVLMPSLPEEIVGEGEPLRELGGLQEG